MSIFSPKLMKTQPFYPTWMGGGIKIDVVVTAPGGSPLTSVLYDPNRKISITIKSLMLTQDDIEQTLRPKIKRKQFRKMKYNPTIEIIKVTFKDDNN